MESCKTCVHCGAYLPLVDFHKNVVMGRLNTCKSCAKDAQIKRYKENPQQYKNNHLWKTYRMTLAQYENMVQAQKGLCLSCNKAEEGLKVDFDRSYCTVKGLLCLTCAAKKPKQEPRTER